MTLDPYAHEHSAVMELTWPQFNAIMMTMTEKIGKDWRPDIVIGIAKGGVIPGVFLSSAFQVDFFPVKLSSRHNERIVRKEPEWFIYPTMHVKGKKVLLVDDICIAGRTFDKAVRELNGLGAAEIRTAAIAAHGGSVRPDYVGMVTDDCVVWPWDRDIYTKECQWAINPEYLEEMKKHGGQSS